jgi:hypothetical protein
MALNRQILQDGIMDIFTNLPSTKEETAQRWSEAIDNYAASIIPPSTTNQVAKQAFYNVFLQINYTNGIVVFQQAFQQYTTQLSLGMAPLYVGTPPPVPINLLPSFIGLTGAPKEVIVPIMVNIIDIWFRTGLASNQSGAIPWS